jgi:hypothetical protein
MRGMDARTPAAETKLLRHFALGKSIGAACKCAGIGRSTYYDWRAGDPDFARRADDAIEDGTDAIEDNALAQAKKGAQTLMVLILKSRRPEKYRDRFEAQVSGPGGGPIQITGIEVPLPARPDGPEDAE